MLLESTMYTLESGLPPSHCFLLHILIVAFDHFIFWCFSLHWLALQNSEELTPNIAGYTCSENLVNVWIIFFIHMMKTVNKLFSVRCTLVIWYFKTFGSRYLEHFQRMCYIQVNKKYIPQCICTYEYVHSLSMHICIIYVCTQI